MTYIQFHFMLILWSPIFANNWRGLEMKRNKDEYVSIRDIDLQDSAAGPENSHRTLWIERYPTFKMEGVIHWHMMTDETSVHLTGPYTHRISRKCTISEALRSDSTTYLQKLFAGFLMESTGVHYMSAITPSKEALEQFNTPCSTILSAGPCNAHYKQDMSMSPPRRPPEPSKM